jgi:hypothetical protein
MTSHARRHYRNWSPVLEAAISTRSPLTATYRGVFGGQSGCSTSAHRSIHLRLMLWLGYENLDLDSFGSLRRVEFDVNTSRVLTCRQTLLLTSLETKYAATSNVLRHSH